MFGDMMGKLQEMQQKTEEIKKRLDNINVEGDAENGRVTAVCTANRKIVSIHISEELKNSDKEELEDLVILAVNRALEKAEKIAEAEMAGAAKGMLPGFGL